MSLERACATAAHWTEQQYHKIVHPTEGDPHRLMIVADASPLGSSGGPKASADIRGFLVAQHLPPEWELENIVVAQAARRMGLGKGLLNTLLAAARNTHSEAVFLEVRESNVAARSLYGKTGFELTGHRKAYYTNPAEDAVLYRLHYPKLFSE